MGLTQPAISMSVNRGEGLVKEKKLSIDDFLAWFIYLWTSPYPQAWLIYLWPLIPNVKYERVYLHNYETVQEAVRDIGGYFDFYNNERPHQSLDYQTPAEVYFNGFFERKVLP